MAYFTNNMSGEECGGKIVADIFVALLILAFSIAFFGLLGGLASFIITEAALLGVDSLMPNDEHGSGAAIR